MKRFCLLAMLMLFSPSAHAGDGLSFSIGGQRIHIDSARCRSLSCVSVSGASRGDGGGGNGHAVQPPSPAPATTGAIPAAPVASNPPAPARRAAPAPPPIVVYKPAPVVPPPPAAAPPPSPPPAPRVVVMPPPPAAAAPLPPPVAAPAEPARPVPQLLRVSREADDEPGDGPIGDWQTDANGLVRIRLCGRALCGYVLDQSSRDMGEAVLINMKPKKDAQWSGSVYSQDSGNIYYGTIELKGEDRLRVETCTLGHFYCTGSDWSHVSRSPQRMITARQSRQNPRS